MDPHLIVIPAATFMITAALLGFVLLQPTRSTLFPALVATLVSILAWIGGIIVISLAPVESLRASAGVIVHFAGVCGVAASFAVLALGFARVSLIEQNPRATVAAIAMPSILAFLTVSTNPWHGLFGAALDGSFLTAGQSWRGPLYGLLVSWVYLATGGGLGVLVWRAFVTPDGEERRRLALVSLTASTPLLGYSLQNLGIVPVPQEVPVATICLTASALIVIVGVLKYRFLATSLLPLRQVIAHLEDGLLLADPKGNIAEANPAAARLAGLEMSVLLGARVHDVLDRLGDDGSVARGLFAADGGGSTSARLEGSDGSVVDVSCGWVQGRREAPIGCFAVLSDRTEEQRHQRLRHRAQRLESVGVLLGGLAHEINNPLAYVRANLGHLAEQFEALKLGTSSPDKDAWQDLSEVVDDSLEGLARIATVVTNTRNLVPREGNVPLAPVDINAIVEETLVLAVRYTKTTNRVEAHLARERPLVAGSADRLRQVLLNLLVNACQATASQGSLVRVSTQIMPTALEIRVEDDGPGVNPPIRERIFDPFFTTKDPDRGMGLGLSIVHDIVREHGGEIELAASKLGGAAFVVQLPYPAGDTAPDPAPSAID